MAVKSYLVEREKMYPKVEPRRARDARTNRRVPTAQVASPRVCRFGRCEHFVESFAVNQPASTPGDKLACLGEVGCVVSMTPAEQMPEVGERLASGWKPSELAQNKTPDHAPVSNPNRRRQSNDDICHVKARPEPLVINPLN